MFDIKQLDNAYDPQEQLLIALGVHPDQKEAQQTVTDSLPKPDTAAASPGSAPSYPATPASMAADNGIAPIARPSGARPVITPEQRQANDQAELDRLKSTGSGISQIHNPLLRGIARVGEIAGSVLFPSIVENIPGTELHHRQLVDQAQGSVANDLGVQSKQAQIAQEQATTKHTQAETDALDNKPSAPPKPFFDQAGDLIGFQSGEELLGPNSPKLTPDMRDMIAATKGKKSAAGTPDAQAMADLVANGDATGKKYTAYEAWQKINQDKSDNKPDSAAQHKQAFESTLQKAISGAGGNVDPQVYTSLAKAADFIKQSKTLAPEEKSAALAYLGANSTPMSSGSTATLRVEGFGKIREQQVIDSKTGNLEFRNADEINEANKLDPGRYLPAAAGGKDMQKQALINDIRGAATNLKKNMAVMDEGTWSKVNLAAAIADPHSTAQAFIQSIPRGSLSDQQMNFVNDLYTLRENAMAMRAVLGSGSSAEDARRAILNTLPGPNTPNAKFGNAQVDNIMKTLERVEKGLPTNTPQRGGTEGKKNEPKHAEEVKYPGFVVDQ